MWQPIETAPTDGTPVLFYYPEGRSVPYLGNFGRDHITEPDMAVMRYAAEDGYGADYKPFWHGYYAGIEPDGSPTHWMPLPPPPGLAERHNDWCAEYVMESPKRRG